MILSIQKESIELESLIYSFINHGWQDASLRADISITRFPIRYFLTVRVMNLNPFCRFFLKSNIRCQNNHINCCILLVVLSTRLPML